MIKGILMSVEGTTGVVITREGAFKKVSLPKSLQAKIGEEVTVPIKTFHIPKQPLFSVLAACLVLFTLFGVWGASSQNHAAAAAYISFDINPSFEAGVNQDLKIVSLKPLNSDGKRILSNIKDAKTMSLSEFTNRVADVLDQDGYFKQNPKMVVSTTITSKLDNGNKNQLEKQINSAIKSIQNQPDFLKHDGALSVMQTSVQERAEASKKGLTAGKYALYLKAKKAVPSVTLEKVKQMTINQLLEVQPKKEPNKQGLSNSVESKSKGANSNKVLLSLSADRRGKPITHSKNNLARAIPPGQLKKLRSSQPNMHARQKKKPIDRVVPGKQEIKSKIKVKKNGPGPIKRIYKPMLKHEIPQKKQFHWSNKKSKASGKWSKNDKHFPKKKGGSFPFIIPGLKFGY